MRKIQSMGTELVWVVTAMVYGGMGSGRMIGYNIQHVSTDRASAWNLYTYLTIDDKSFVRVDKISYEYIVCATTDSATDRHSLQWCELWRREGETETRVRDKWKRATLVKKIAWNTLFLGGVRLCVRSDTYTHMYIIYSIYIYNLSYYVKRHEMEVFEWCAAILRNII